MAPSRMDSSPESEVRVRDDNPVSQGMEAIAVIGLATGFPQDIASPEVFWKAMLQERCTVSDFPESRMNIASIYHPDPDRKGQASHSNFGCTILCLISDSRWLSRGLTSWTKIWPHLMRHFFQSRLQMQPAWIPSNGCSLSTPT